MSLEAINDEYTALLEKTRNNAIELNSIFELISRKVGELRTFIDAQPKDTDYIEIKDKLKDLVEPITDAVNRINTKREQLEGLNTSGGYVYKTQSKKRKRKRRSYKFKSKVYK